MMAMHHKANTDRAVIAARDTDATTHITEGNCHTKNISILHLKLVLPRVVLLELLSGRGQFLVRGTRQRSDNDLVCKAQTTGLARSYSGAR